MGRPHFRLRHALPEIREKYLRSTFVFDMMGIIPVQYVDCVFEPGTLPSGVKALHLVRLIKLLRLYRIRKLIKVRKKNPISRADEDNGHFVAGLL